MVQIQPFCLFVAYIITSVIFLQAMIDVDELYRCPVAKEEQLRKDNKVHFETSTNANLLQPIPKYIITMF